MFHRLWDLVVTALFLAAAAALLRWGYLYYYRAAYPIHYRESVERYSSEMELPASLVYAVIRTESGFDATAQSSVPARGLMQITQETFEWAQLRSREQQQLHYDDLYQSDLNIYYGTLILRLLQDDFGSQHNALCAYHAGWGSATRWLADPKISPDAEHITHIPFGDTKRYVAKVTETQQIYRKLYNQS